MTSIGHIEKQTRKRVIQLFRERPGYHYILPEQTAIATITVLSDMDAEIAALQARRDKTRALKQGMMQELLTGRIRLGITVAAAND